MITYLWFLKIVWNYTFLSTEEIIKLEKSLTKKFSLMHVPLVIGRSVDNFISADWFNLLWWRKILNFDTMILHWDVPCGRIIADPQVPPAVGYVLIRMFIKSANFPSHSFIVAIACYDLLQFSIDKNLKPSKICAHKFDVCVKGILVFEPEVWLPKRCSQKVREQTCSFESLV